jgi:hypothetical protein
MPKIIRQRGSAPGRHHVGIPGDIISERPGDFVGIRNAIRFLVGPIVFTLSKRPRKRFGAIM